MNPRSVVIRAAQADDATLLGAVHVRIWRETYRGQMPDALLDGLDASRFADGWRRRIAESEDDGAGVGQRLLEASIGQEPAYLWVAEGNARARRFYEKNGFRLDDGYQDDERLGIRELRMMR